MKGPKELSRDDILRTAQRFRVRRKMPKWRVIVEDREFPARPLVLEAAGVAPNDPTNSHQAVAILEQLGFEIRYATHERVAQAAGPDSGAKTLVEMFSTLSKAVPEREWKRIPADLSKEVDRYLYADKKTDR